MFALALKNARANRDRFSLTAFAVIASVAFLTATFVLADSMTGTASENIAAANSTVDLVVRGDVLVTPDSGPGEPAVTLRAALPDQTAEVVASIDGVADAQAVTTAFAKLVVGGEALGAGQAADIGSNWISNPRLSPFTLVEGAEPRGTGQVAIDQAVALESDLSVGQAVQVLTSTGVNDVEISGIVSYGGAGQAPLRRSTLFDSRFASQILGHDAGSLVLIEAAPDADQSELVRRIGAAIEAGSVSTQDEYIATEQAAAVSPFSFLSVFLRSFAVVAVLVGSTLIYNTFSIAMARRRREMALLRAVGAERRFVLRTVMVEASLVAVASTVVGAVVGLVVVDLLEAFFSSIGLDFLEGPRVINTTSMGAAVAIGVVVTVLSAWFPARRAAGAAPIEALRDSSVEEVGRPRLRTVVGVTCVAVGVGGAVVAAIRSDIAVLGVGALVIPGLALTGPALVSRGVALVRPIARRLGGVEGLIATTNLDRNPRRASSTTLALTLGVALVAFFSMLGSSLSASLGINLDDALRADHVVTSLTPDSATIDPALTNRLGSIEGVTSTASLRQAAVGVDGEPAILAGVDSEEFQTAFDVGLVTGSFDAIEEGGLAVVVEDVEAGPRLGDVLTVSSTAGSFTVEVVAIIENSTGGFSAPSHFVSTATMTSIAPNLPITTVFVNTSNPQATQQLRSLVAGSPGSLLADRTTYIANTGSEVAQVLSLIYAMLGLTVIIAIVGVANTTTLSISERTREFGLLRAVGATATSVRRIVRIEALLMSILGTTAGLTLAAGAAWALINADGGSEVTKTTVPWLAFAVLGIGGAFGGLAAATIPAWRASRLPTLAALTN